MNEVSAKMDPRAAISISAFRLRSKLGDPVRAVGNLANLGPGFALLGTVEFCAGK